ncbi:MAG: hypothetical protein M1819_003833 [Sarea resinae]|nr:MAG: hypothetical protein M1819_003833 [Sarea resinae]
MSTTPSKLKDPAASPKAIALEHKAVPFALSPRKDASSGRKRSIAEVDDAETRTEIRLKPERLAEKAASSSAPRVEPLPSPPANEPQNHTSDAEPSPEARSSQEGLEEQSQSTNNQSMSSLVDYDAVRDAPVAVELHEADAGATPAPEQPTASSQAELLRLRLRVAMYKVRTNQTSVPLSELEIAPRRQPIIPSATIDSEDSGSSQQSISDEQPDLVPKLLPAPILAPTAYSKSIGDLYVPSSPPKVEGRHHEGDIEQADVEDGENRFKTPVISRRRDDHSPMQLSSPPDSQDRQDHNPRDKNDEVHLTSSVVKGRAATGLLDLMNRG